MPLVKVINPNNMTQLENVSLHLTEIVSEPYTVFDELQTGDGQVGIAQGHSGSLQIENDLLNPPELALRSHLYTYGNTSFMIPYMRLPVQGMLSQTFGSETWYTTDNLKLKGSNVFLRCKQIDPVQNIEILMGQYNWQSDVQQTDGLLAFVTNKTELNNICNEICLPQAGVVNPVGPNAQADA